MHVRVGKNDSARSCRYSTPTWTAQVTFGIDGFDNKPMISLILRSEQVSACESCQSLEESRMSPGMLAPIPTMSDLRIPQITFSLISNGIIHCPTASRPLPFTDYQTPDFIALSILCQTIVVDVIIGKGQLSLEHQRQVEHFVNGFLPALFVQLPLMIIV